MAMVGLEKSLNSNKTTKGVVPDKTNNRFTGNKFVEFCKRTDLHGWKYIVMTDINAVERGCWAFAVLISVIMAAFFVVLAYKWYARNPIVTVIESTQGAIWDVPFPAVTICDLNIVSRRAARKFTDNLTLPNNITAEFIFNTLKFVPLLLSTFPTNRDHRDTLQQLQLVLNINNKTIDDLFTEISPTTPCSNLLKRCMWKNAIYPCDELFTPIFTLLGQCCTFNYYAIEDSKDQNTSRLPEPRRVASCGYQTALTVLLNTHWDDYYSSIIASQGALGNNYRIQVPIQRKDILSNAWQGWKWLTDQQTMNLTLQIIGHAFNYGFFFLSEVIIDGAFNIPDLDSPVRMVNPSTEVLIALSPERTYATDGIKNFATTQRQCYYSNEWPLGGFRQYSFHNCMAYEKVDFLLKVCKCVPLFFPMKGDHRKCNFMDLDCLDKTLRKVGSLNVTSEQNLITSECLPECEHYDYPLEVALGKLAEKNYVNNLPLFRDVIIKNHSLLNVFFNDLVSTRYRRDVYLNWQNILAAFGGLLSLMLGFTLIAAFDVVVFFTLRVVYDYYKVWTDDSRSNKIIAQDYRKSNAWTENSVPYALKHVHTQGKDEYMDFRRKY